MIDPEDPEYDNSDQFDDGDWGPFEDEYEDWDEESYGDLYQNHNESYDDEDLDFSPVVQDEHADYWEAYSSRRHWTEEFQW